MDDGSRSPLAGLIVLVMLILLNGILYGFAAAVRNLNQSEIQKMAEEGNKKAGLLKRLIDEPVRYVNAIPLIVTASGIFIGVFLVPLLARISHRYIDQFPALVLISILCVVLLASFGILMFRRIGDYRSRQYAFRYVRLVSIVVFYSDSYLACAYYCRCFWSSAWGTAGSGYRGGDHFHCG